MTDTWLPPITCPSDKLLTFGELETFESFRRTVDYYQRYDVAFGYVVYSRDNGSTVVSVFRLSDDNKVVINYLYNRRLSAKLEADDPYIVGDDVVDGLNAIVEGEDDPTDHYLLDELGGKAALVDNGKAVTIFMARL